MKQFVHVILGGTFDHFHKGHRALIDKAFVVGAQVTIGIAKENLYKNKLLSQSIESFETRCRSVEDYLKSNRLLPQSKIVPITDIFGPSITDKTIAAVIASKQTYQNTLLINQKRSEVNFPALKIIIVDDVLADDGKLLTSERIRAGEIDREGFVYVNFFDKTLTLPENMREELRKPLDKVFADTTNLLQCFKTLKSTMVIAVGDIISQSLEDNGFVPDVKVIDFRSRRQAINSKSETRNPKQAQIPNKAGTIDKKATAVLQSSFNQHIKTKEKQIIVIDGEEDLLALPAILLAPLNSVILYGQMDLGAVVVRVTEEKKTQVQDILKKLT